MARSFFLTFYILFQVGTAWSQDSFVRSGYTVDEFAGALRLGALVNKNSSEFSQHLIQTPLGRVSVRVPYDSSLLLNVRPTELVNTAWTVGAAILVKHKFPQLFVADSQYDWNVVFVPRILSTMQKRALGSNYCHMAMMGPPADVVIDINRVLNPCGASSSKPQLAVLVSSLIHEIGHAVEFRLLGNAFPRRERWHSEGFATWFESLGQEIIDSSSDSSLKNRARSVFSMKWRPYLFSGSPADYLQSYAMLAVIAEQSPEKLFAVYQRMSAEHLGFSEAVGKTLGWTFSQWLEETRKFLD